MQDVLLYMSAFFMVFLSCAVVCFCLRFSIWVYLEYLSPQEQLRRRNRMRLQATRRDRQGNVFAIHDETSRERRYDDIFFIEPNSVEAARIRAQLEKDEKDLPSYEEVMRMANLSSPTAAPAASPLDTVAPGGDVSINASSSSVHTTETTLSVPPYVAVDLSAASNSTRSITPPPYSPPTSAVPAVVLPITTSVQTQQTSSNV